MQRYSGLYLLIKHNIYIANKTIYKIGKSINLHKRLYEYPKSSYLYLLILCDDINKHERELINLFKIKFILERSYGQEYFSGNILDMIHQIKLYTQTHIAKYSIIDFNKGLELTVIIDNNISKKTIDKYLNNIVYTNNDNITTNTNANFISSTNNNSVCPCGKSFPYYYLLDRHQKGSRGCSYTNSLKKNDIIPSICNKCNKCNKTLANKYNLVRHNKICKATITIPDSSKQLDKKIIDMLDTIIDKINKIKTKNNIDIDISLLSKINNILDKLNDDTQLTNQSPIIIKPNTDIDIENIINISETTGNEIEITNIELNNNSNNVRDTNYKDTDRCKYFNDMTDLENQQLNTEEQSIGNINAVIAIRLKRMEDEIKTLKEHYNLTQNQERKLRLENIVEPSNKIYKQVAEIRENI